MIAIDEGLAKLTKQTRLRSDCDQIAIDEGLTQPTQLTRLQSRTCDEFTDGLPY